MTLVWILLVIALWFYMFVKISKYACATYKMPVLRSDGLSYVHCQISILASCVFQAVSRFFTPIDLTPIYSPLYHLTPLSFNPTIIPPRF